MRDSIREIGTSIGNEHSFKLKVFIQNGSHEKPRMV